jgi:hypothetical protein
VDKWTELSECVDVVVCRGVKEGFFLKKYVRKWKCWKILEFVEEFLLIKEDALF